jgi:hypothetical protein
MPYVALFGPDGAHAPETFESVPCGTNSRGEIAPGARDDLWFVVSWTTDKGYRPYGWADSLPEGARVPVDAGPFFAQIG